MWLLWPLLFKFKIRIFGFLLHEKRLAVTKLLKEMAVKLGYVISNNFIHNLFSYMTGEVKNEYQKERLHVMVQPFFLVFVLFSSRIDCYAEYSILNIYIWVYSGDIGDCTRKSTSNLSGRNSIDCNSKKW
jgi:hypothetical protein